MKREFSGGNTSSRILLAVPIERRAATLAAFSLVRVLLLIKMKNIVLTLLLVAIVLFVTVESHGPKRGRGRRPWFGRRPSRPSRPSWLGEHHGKLPRPCNETEPPSNCSLFVNGTCLECEEGFALETFNFSRRPYHTHNSWFNRGNSRFRFRLFRNRKPAGNGANFRGCNKTMSRCVPCSRYLEKIDPGKCRHGGCGPGCINCSSLEGCIECRQGLKLYTPPDSEKPQCIPPICEPNVKPTVEEGESVVLEP